MVDRLPQRIKHRPGECMNMDYTQHEIELMIDAIWMRQRCFIAGDKRFQEYGKLLDVFMAQRPDYTPGKYR